MEMVIKPLSPALSADYFDFFENRAFTDNSPYRCYCQVYQMTIEAEKAAMAHADGADIGLISKNMAQQQLTQACCGAIWRMWTVWPSGGAMQTTEQIIPRERVKVHISMHRQRSAKKRWCVLKLRRNFAAKVLLLRCCSGLWPMPKPRATLQSRAFPFCAVSGLSGIARGLCGCMRRRDLYRWGSGMGLW